VFPNTSNISDTNPINRSDEFNRSEGFRFPLWRGIKGEDFLPQNFAISQNPSNFTLPNLIKMSNFYYNKNLRDFAWELRNESRSKAEKYLWKAALSRNQMGVKFKRQRPILNFIVDFFAPEIKLIIEIDGSSHLAKAEYDAYRQERLEKIGCTFLRFQEGEVLNQYDKVHMQIEHAVHCLKMRIVPPPCPPPKGEGYRTPL
jgi:very-short-patch-repair endonuclease